MEVERRGDPPGRDYASPQPLARREEGNSPLTRERADYVDRLPIKLGAPSY